LFTFLHGSFLHCVCSSAESFQTINLSQKTVATLYNRIYIAGTCLLLGSPCRKHQVIGGARCSALSAHVPRPLSMRCTGGLAELSRRQHFNDFRLLLSKTYILSSQKAA